MEDRKACLDALELASVAGDQQPFQVLMLGRLDETFREYARILEEALP